MEVYIPIIGVTVLIFVLLGLGLGFVRGLSRIVFRLNWVLLTAVIVFFIAPLFTKAFLNMNISAFGITISGVKIATLNEVVIQLIKQIPQVGELLAQPEGAQIILAVVQLGFHSISFVLLFLFLNLLLWPVWKIASNAIEKRKSSLGRKGKKRKFSGMLIGGLLGVFMGAVTIMPAVGLVQAVVRVENETTALYTSTITNSFGEDVTITEEYGQITNLGGGEILNLLEAYENSFVGNVFKFTGINLFASTTFTGLTASSFKGENANFKNELKSITLALSAVKEMQGLEYQKLTQENVSLIIEKSRELVDKLYNIKSFSVYGDKLFNKIINDAITNPQFIIQLPKTENELMDIGIENMAKELTEIKFKQVKDEINKLFNIAQILNDKDVFVAISNNKINKAEELVNYLDEKSVLDITNELVSMEASQAILPSIINSALNELANYLDIQDFQANYEELEYNEVKQVFKIMVESSFAIYNTLDLKSEYYITKNTLPKIGELLDAVKNYQGLTNENYLILINSLQQQIYNKADAALQGLDEQFVELKNIILNSVTNLKEVVNFEEEFAKLYSVYDSLILIIDGFIENNITSNLLEYGKVLDVTKSTILFSDAVPSIAQFVMDYIAELIPVEYVEFKTLIPDVKANISKVQSWQLEFEKIDKSIETISNLLAVGDYETLILNKEQTLLNDLGFTLNNLSTSKLFGNPINGLVKILLDKIENSIEQSEIANEIFSTINDTIDEVENVNWQIELSDLRKLFITLNDFQKDDGTIGMEQLGKVFDEINNSGGQFLGGDIFNLILKTSIDNFANKLNDNDFESVIVKVKQNVDNTKKLNYQQELKALNQLMQEIENIKIETFNFSSFGNLLDNFNTPNGHLKSELLSPLRNDLVLIILNKVPTTNFTESMETLLAKVKSNTTTISSNYKLEMEKLQDFKSLAESLNDVNQLEFDFVDFGLRLDGYSSSVLLSDIRSGIVQIMFEEIDVTNLNEDIVDILKKIKTNALQVQDNYANEFDKLNQFITLKESFTNSDLQSFKFDNFGKTLDDFADSVLLASVRNDVRNDIVMALLNEVDISQLSEDSAEIFNKIKSNVNLIYNNYSAEFIKFSKFIDMAENFKDSNPNDLDLKGIGETLDGFSSSVLLQTVRQDIAESMLNEFAKIEEDEDVLLLIKKINNNISLVKSNYTFEFTKLNELTKTLNNIKNFNVDEFNFISLGKMLDGFSESIVLADVRNDVIVAMLNRFDTTELMEEMTDVVLTIKENAELITKNYEVELTKLAVFVDLISTFENIEGDTFPFREVGEKLDGFNSSRLLESIRHDLVLILLSQIDTYSMNEDLQNVMQKIKENVKEITGSYQLEFATLKAFLDLTDSELKNIDKDSFDFSDFGTELDGFASSKLIKTARPLIVKTIINSITLTNENNEIQIAINEILHNTYDQCLIAETGNPLYKTLLIELGSVEAKISDIQNFTISKDNANVLNIGVRLDELKNYNIVSTIACVRISNETIKYLVGSNGISTLLPPDYESIPEVKNRYDAIIDACNDLLNEYENYIQNKLQTDVNFTSQYSTLNDMVNKLMLYVS